MQNPLHLLWNWKGPFHGKNRIINKSKGEPLTPETKHESELWNKPSQEVKTLKPYIKRSTINCV